MLASFQQHFSQPALHLEEVALGLEKPTALGDLRHRDEVVPHLGHVQHFLQLDRLVVAVKALPHLQQHVADAQHLQRAVVADADSCGRTARLAHVEQQAVIACEVVCRATVHHQPILSRLRRRRRVNGSGRVALRLHDRIPECHHVKVTWAPHLPHPLQRSGHGEQFGARRPAAHHLHALDEVAELCQLALWHDERRLRRQRRSRLALHVVLQELLGLGKRRVDVGVEAAHVLDEEASPLAVAEVVHLRVGAVLLGSSNEIVRPSLALDRLVLLLHQHEVLAVVGGTKLSVGPVAETVERHRRVSGRVPVGSRASARHAAAVRLMALAATVAACLLGLPAVERSMPLALTVVADDVGVGLPAATSTTSATAAVAAPRSRADRRQRDGDLLLGLLAAHLAEGLRRLYDRRQLHEGDLVVRRLVDVRVEHTLVACRQPREQPMLHLVGCRCATGLGHPLHDALQSQAPGDDLLSLVHLGLDELLV